MLVAAVSTSGCAALQARSATPDEFAVARNAPLVIPPDFSLTPPVAGTAGLTAERRPAAGDRRPVRRPRAAQRGETSMLDAAGRDRAQIGIRSTVWDPDTRIVDKGPTTLTILAAPAGEQQHRLGPGRQ